MKSGVEITKESRIELVYNQYSFSLNNNEMIWQSRAWVKPAIRGFGLGMQEHHAFEA